MTVRELTKLETESIEDTYRESVGEDNNGARIYLNLEDGYETISTPIKRAENEDLQLKHQFVCNKEKIYIYIAKKMIK